MNAQSVTCLLTMLLAWGLRSRAASGADWGANAELFGLAIGFNLSDDPNVPPLRYADDDAVQNARLLTQLGAQVILLTNLDSESKPLHPGLEPTPPTKAAVTSALNVLNERMEEARRQGRTPILYFFYSGHGDVEHNEGYVHLEDGRLWRKDFLQLLKQSRAEENHVVVDACKSYFLVFSRGAGGERQPVRGQLLEDERDLPTNTGVFLSTSSAADSHEWEAFQGGVFSHELRSALRGAADLNLDGSVTYEEASAFIWWANAAIPNRRYQPVFFSHAPGSGLVPEAVLAKVDRVVADRLEIGPGIDRHVFIEDGFGRRIADVHPATSSRFVLLLPKERPLFLKWIDLDEEAELPEGKTIRLSELSTHKRSTLLRGAEHVAFRLLFDRNFDASVINAYRTRPPETIEQGVARKELTYVRRGIGVGALILGAAGGALTGLALNERNGVSVGTSGLERNGVNERIDRFNTAAVICYALASSALAAYLVWTLWPEDDVAVQFLPGPVPQIQLKVGIW